ncbi:MAG: hypothetical protein ACR2RV_05655 [Verrucomicrobiales bacterium]
MADPEKHTDNDDPENIGDDTEFLKGGIDAGSDLDELTFEDDELVDLSGSGSSAIDEILGSPLTSAEDESPATGSGTSQIPAARSDSEIPGSGSVLDQALTGQTNFPDPATPQNLGEEDPPAESAGNQRLDPSQRRTRPRPRPRPRQRSAPAEDEIIFDDDDDFAGILPEEPEETSPVAELPPSEPELPTAPEPIVEATTSPASLHDFEPEPAFEPTPTPEPAPVTPPPAIPEIPPVGLGEIDDEFEDLPDVPEPALPPQQPPETPSQIDPTPVPDFKAMAQPTGLPRSVADPDVEDFDPPAPAPAAPAESTPDDNTGAQSIDEDELAAEEAVPPPPPPPEKSDTKMGLGNKLFGQLAPLELASLAVIAVGCIFGVFLFNSWSKSGLPPRTVLEKPAESVPSSLDGQIIQASSLEAYWRARNENDSSKITSGFLPELELTLAGSANGYLLAIFRNDEGQLVGTADLKVEAGKVVSTGSQTGTLTSPVGLDNEFVLATYRVEDKWRWQVTLKESVDKEDWAEIAHFYFPADSR